MMKVALYRLQAHTTPVSPDQLWAKVGELPVTVHAGETALQRICGKGPEANHVPTVEKGPDGLLRLNAEGVKQAMGLIEGGGF
jgi:hypothetical protein